MASSGTSRSDSTATGALTPFLARLLGFFRSLLRDKRIRGVLQLTLSLALLAWLINRVGLDAIFGTLAGVSWEWYVPAFLLFLGNVLLRAYRWYLLVSALEQQVPYRRLIYLYFVGFFFNNFIPSGFGGDIVKVISLRQDQAPGAEALSSVVVDRLTGLIGSAVIALVVLTWNRVQLWFGGGTAGLNLPPVLMLATALISLGAPIGFLVIRSIDPLVLIGNHLPFTRPITTKSGLQKFVRTIRRYPPHALIKALCVSIPFTIALVATQYAIARALSIQVPFYLFSLFVPIIAIINVLPISFNGLGMREGVYQFLFVPVGVSSAGAIAMSLAFYFLRVTAGLIGGLLYAVKNTRRLIRGI
jgi:uncharacterized protein (TIRG00374 family)